MKRHILLATLILGSITLSAQKIEKVRRVNNKKTELSQEDLKLKRKHILRLINLGYTYKTIRLKTNASIKQIKAIRKESEI